MEEILKCLEYNKSNINEYLTRFYQIFSEYNPSNKLEENYLLKCILPKVYCSLSKHVMKTDILFLSVIANRNHNLLQVCIEYNKQVFDIDFKKASSLYNYCIYKKQHWFEERIYNRKTLENKDYTDDVILVIRLIKATNEGNIDTTEIKNLLQTITTNQLDEFWKYYISEIQQMIKILQFCKQMNPNIKNDKILDYICNHTILEIFSRHLNLNIHSEKILNEIIEYEKFYNTNKEACIFHGFMILMDIFHCLLLEKTQNINQIIDKLSARTLNLENKSLRLELLENIFATIFFKKSHLLNKENENDFICNEKEMRLILYLLKSMLEEIRLKSPYEKDSSEFKRFSNLNKYVTDANWKLELIVSVRNSKKIENNLLHYMLARPDSLIRMCLNQGDFERAYQVIGIFELQNLPITNEIQYMEKLQDLKEKLQKSFKIKALAKENRNISTVNMEPTIYKYVENFIISNPAVPNIHDEIIEHHVEKNNFLLHYITQNERFMNVLDLAITQPSKNDDCEVILKLAYKNCNLSNEITSNYSGFYKMLVNIFNEVGSINKFSLSDILNSSDINLDIMSHRKDKNFYNKLAEIYDEFCDYYKIEEPGSLNSSHPCHKSLMKMNDIINEYVGNKLDDDNVKYLTKLYNYLKAFSRVLHIEQNNCDIISQGKNTPFFELLNYNRSELMGKLLFERHLDPSEFEKYFGKLKLDYLYHVIGNCFPTINLHTQEDVTEEELYPENNLYVPSKSIITYIQKRNWLLAFVLNEIYKVEDLKIDISEVRIQTLLNYMKLPKIQNLKTVFNNNAILTTLQNDISYEKVSNYFSKQIQNDEECAINTSQISSNSNDSLETAEELHEDILKSTNWKALYDIVCSIPEGQLMKNQEFLNLKDTILANLVHDSFEIDYFKYVQFISQRKMRIDTLFNNFKSWPGDFCIYIISSEITKFKRDNDNKNHQLEAWLQQVELCEELSHILVAQAWSKCFDLCDSNPNNVMVNVLQLNKVELLLKFIDLYDIPDEILLQVDEDYVSRILDTTPKLHYINELFEKLPFEHSIKICYNLLKMVKKLNHLQFIVDYVMANTDDDCLKNIEISLKMLTAFTTTEQEQLLCLIHEPLSIVEILIMNTKLDKLAAVLEILKSEIMHTEYDDNGICVEKIDELLRSYAEKSLDFRVITQPNPRLLLTPECKLMQSLDSLNLGSDKRLFIMPDSVPAKEDWVQNNEVLECMCCQQVTFSMFNRRHHCRRCGRVICYNCSLKRMLVHTYGDILVRVCSDCYEQTFGASFTSEMSDTVSTKSMIHDYWLLTDDQQHNKIVREEFSYEHAPSVSLCLSILKYHSKSVEYPQFLLEQCDLMLKLLQPSQEPIQEIDYLLVIKMLKSLAIAAKMSSIECALHYGSSLSERILSQADLLGLLAERGCLNLLPISHSPSSYIDASVLRRLRDKLLEREQWNLALEVSTKAGLDNAGVFAAWGKSCLKAGSLILAREKFQRCFDRSSLYDNITDYSTYSELDESIENSSRLRYSSKLSNLGIASENKPIKNPPLLNEIQQILESKTQKIDLDVMKNAEFNEFSGSVISLNQSFTTSSRPDVAYSILNKLKNLKAISSGVYYQSSDTIPVNSNRPNIYTIFYEECIYYLTRYGTHLSLLEFYIKHGKIDEALVYILDNRLSTEIFIEIYMRCLKEGIINIVQKHMSKIDTTLDIWKEYLRQICRHLEKQNMLNSLYQIQQYMGDYIRAAMTCIRFYKENVTNFTELSAKVNFLEKAEEHFKQILEQEQWVEVASVRKLSRTSTESFEEKGLTTHSLVMKINPKDIDKHIKTIWSQNEIANFLAGCESNQVKPMDLLLGILPSEENKCVSEKNITIPTLFGSYQEKTHLAILAIISGPTVESGFDISLKIIQNFKLKPVKVYCQAGKELAKIERYDGIAQLVSCIKSTGNKDGAVTDMCDEMLTLAVATFTKANVSGTKVEDLIKLISDKATKISAYIEAKQLKTAYFLAVKYKRMSDIRRILREAELLNQPSIKALCQKVLQTHSHAPSHTKE